MSIDLSLPVRLAGPADEDELLRLCRAKHGEEALRNASGQPFAFSEVKARATLQRAIVSGRNEPDTDLAWCAVVASPEGQIAGSSYLTMQTPYDSDDAYLCEHWSWIWPQHRKSDVGRRLLMWSQAKAVSMGLPLIGGVVSYDEDSPKMRFFKRAGFEPLAALYLYTGEGAN